MKLILFDFDGVLVDTLGICFAINIGVKPDLSIEEYKSFFEGNIHDAIKSGRKKPIPNFDEQYSLKTRELKVPEKLKELLQKLSLNYMLAMVSSTSTPLIKNILEREGLLTYFSDILGSDMHQSKVIKIKTLLEKYNIVPEETIFITDTSGDVLEARKCGIESIAVTWGFHEIKTLSKQKPFALVDTPLELEQKIEEFFK